MTHHKNQDPYYVRQTQDWAVDTERMRHNQALYMVGEWTMFVLMWHIEDFEDGLVGRCPTCYTSYGKVAEAYGQQAKRDCLDCFGTTFEGGYKAQIVRPAVFADTDEGEQLERRGVVHSDDVVIESTTDFRIRTGDYCFRADGTRWYLRVPERITLRTGFADPTQRSAAVGYNHARANAEDKSSVAFLIPPRGDQAEGALAAMLTRPAQWPGSVDWSDVEEIRAPLIPEEDWE